MSAAAINAIGTQLQADLVAWGAAVIGIALMAAGAKWIVRLMR